jgi:hypothetical protein
VISVQRPEAQLFGLRRLMIMARRGKAQVRLVH